MQLMLAIAEFHANGSFLGLKLGKFLDTSQPDFASLNLEAEMIYNNTCGISHK